MSLEPDVAKELADMDNAFGVVPPQVKTNAAPLDNYRMVIQNVAFVRSQKLNELLLQWDLTIYDGPYAQYPMERVNFLRSEKNIAWMKRELIACGLECAKLTNSQIAPLLPQLRGVVIDTTTRQSGQYHNIDIQGIANVDRQSPTATDAPPPHGDEDIPDITDPFADQ